MNRWSAGSAGSAGRAGAVDLAGEGVWLVAAAMNLSAGLLWHTQSVGDVTEVNCMRDTPPVPSRPPLQRAQMYEASLRRPKRLGSLVASDNGDAGRRERFRQVAGL